MSEFNCQRASANVIVISNICTARMHEIVKISGTLGLSADIFFCLFFGGPKQSRHGVEAGEKVDF